MSDSAPPPRKALFICTGNSCRSVMAERLLAKISQDRSLGWETRSCGTAAERYFQVSSQVRQVLKAEGVGEFEHIPQLVTRDLLRWSDLALVMTDEHRDEVFDRYPEFEPKLRVLRRHVELPTPNIEDPIGQTLEIHAECLVKIKEAVEALVKKHA